MGLDFKYPHAKSPFLQPWAVPLEKLPSGLCRFMNGTAEGNGIHSEAEAAALVQNVKFSGILFGALLAVHNSLWAFWALSNT